MLPQAEGPAREVERGGNLSGVDASGAKDGKIVAPPQGPDPRAVMKCWMCANQAQCYRHWVCHGKWFKPKPLSEVVRDLK